ncbi:MAG: glutamine synthetase family protein [Burkholderiaceae bacterium]
MNIEDTLQHMSASGIQQVRLAWCDLHGDLRGKTLMPLAVQDALTNGIGLVGTLALKDSSDRTAFKVFEAGGSSAWPEFAGAANLVLRPDLASYQELPWAPGTAWLQGQVHYADGRAVALDTRHMLQTALAQLEAQGLGMQCGLEVEFHIYKIENTRPQLDPDLAAWPGLPPAVSMVHPGYHLLSEQWMDMTDAPLRIVRETAQALGLPLTSLEIELGPSQVEAVFEVTDALSAADNMVLFRSAVKQALRRAGYHATFMCRPPFPYVMSSGWHLHQSLALHDGSNAFAKPAAEAAAQDWYKRAMAQPAPTPKIAQPLQATSYLSTLGCHYLAGLLTHAKACTALTNPNINAYARFQPNALAPQSIVWGHDNRGAMLRVIAPPDTPQATRIENRVGEPMANPYLYLASQIHAGLDGITRKLVAPPACETPYAATAEKLPTSLGDALAALQTDAMLCKALGQSFVDYFCQVKRQEIVRYGAAEDKVDWQRREIFSRH